MGDDKGNEKESQDSDDIKRIANPKRISGRR
jgi:hypothetical protein